MNIQDLEKIASNGLKRDDDSEVPSAAELIAAYEIRNKTEELLKEILSYERWDRNSIGRKTAAIVWFSSRLAGIYGVNLEDELRKKVEENKQEAPVILEKPKTASNGKVKNAKTVYRPKRKLPPLPRISKPKS